MAAAFNIVRFRVKPGGEQAFIDAHRKARPEFKGFLRGNLIKTGDQTFCMVGEWRNFQSLAAARPEMISILDGFRHLLEDLGGGLGVTDPVSGDVVAAISTPKAPRKRPAKHKAAKRPAKKRKR